MKEPTCQISSCTAAALVVLLVGKVQMWTLWVRVTTNNQLNMLLYLLELVAADCVLECCDLPVTLGKITSMI